MMMLSRHMPAAPEHKVKPLAYIFLAVFVLGIVGLCSDSRGSCSGYVGVYDYRTTTTEKIAGTRHEESICSFARSFDCHRADTRIIRAVYEELQNYLKGSHKKFPIHASDRIDEDLRIDRDDLFDIAHDIAARAGYDMANTKTNPYVERLITVEDMVLFFTHQARLSQAEPTAAAAASRGQ